MLFLSWCACIPDEWPLIYATDWPLRVRDYKTYMYVPVLDEPVLLASVFTVADRQNTVVKSLAAARRVGEHTIFVEPAVGMSGYLLIIVADL